MGWGALLGLTALKLSQPRAAASAQHQGECCLEHFWCAGNHGPAGFGVAFKQMSTFIVCFVIKAFEEDLKKEKFDSKALYRKKKGLFVMYWTYLSLFEKSSC